MRRTIGAAAIGALASIGLTTTTPASAEVGRHGPDSYAIRPNRKLLLGGTAAVAGAYFPSAAIAATSDRKGDEWLFVPVIGPVWDLGGREGCVAGGGNCENEQLYRYLLVMSGVVQFAGLVGIVSSFIVPEIRTKPAREAPGADVQVLPMRLARDGYGVGVTGRF